METKGIITIDLDNREIRTSNNELRSFLESNKKFTNNIFSNLDLNSFDIVKTLKKNKGKTKGDKVSLDSIKLYVKANKPELMQELENLINTQAKDKKTEKPLFTKDGKPKKISFLIVKNWYYEKFPEEKPNKVNKK